MSIPPQPACPTQEHGVAVGRQYDSVEAMLDADKLDLLMVGSPNHMHLDHIRIGLERGLKIFAEKPVVTTVAETMELAAPDRRIRLRQHHGRARAALCAALCRPAQGAEGRAARRRRLDRGVGAHSALSRRLLHARLAPLRAIFGQLHARKMLPRSRSLQRRHGLPPDACGELRRAAHVHAARTRRRHRAPTTSKSTTASRAAGMGSEKVFDSDGDIIDFQTAIVEYDNGAALTLPHQSQRAGRFPPLRGDRRQGHGRGRFHPQLLPRHRCAHFRSADRQEVRRLSELSEHYGADEQMAADIARPHARRQAAAGLGRRRAGGGAACHHDGRGAPHAQRRRHDADLAALRQRALGQGSC